VKRVSSSAGLQHRESFPGRWRLNRSKVGVERWGTHRNQWEVRKVHTLKRLVLPALSLATLAAFVMAAGLDWIGPL